MEVMAPEIDPVVQGGYPVVQGADPIEPVAEVV